MTSQRKLDMVGTKVSRNMVDYRKTNKKMPDIKVETTLRAILLMDECRVGTPIRQNLIALNEFVFVATNLAIFTKIFFSTADHTDNKHTATIWNIKMIKSQTENER